MKANPGNDSLYATSVRAPLLERLGVRFFRARSRGHRVENRDGAVHVLSPAERADLRRIHRGAVLRAALAGALSTLAASVAEAWVTPGEGEAENALVFWGAVGGATLIASVIEIGFLYWDALRSVHGLAEAAGLDLFGEAEGEARDAVAAALARAALELPNPTQALLGIDPHRESARWRLAVASLIYKAKIGVTNFVVKALVRRALGRAVVRTWLPFVPVPLTAAWNGIVCHIVLREARIRAMGVSAVGELIEGVVELEGRAPTPAQADAAVRAVAATIVRTEDLHPNLVAVMEGVAAALFDLRPDDPAAPPLDDTAAFLRALAALPADERPFVLRLLGVAAIVDGRMTAPERRLWAEARTAAGLAPDPAPAKALLRAFVGGDRVPLAALRALG